MFEGSDTVTVIRETTDYTNLNEYGEPTKSQHSLTIKGVFVAWGATSTVEEIGRVYISNSITFYLPHGTTILPGDIFLFNNERWEKEGNAQVWNAPPSFESFAPGVVVQAKRIS